jgi:excisionase family DNA binding protein
VPAVLASKKALSTPSAVEPKHLTIKAAAQRHSCAIWYIRSAIWSGTLPAIKAGKRYLVSAASLDKHFAEAAAVI